MKQILLICAVVMVGCGESKEALEPSVTPKATPEKETKNPDLPKAEVKKPLTKEESAEVIEKAIRKELKKPTGELTEADLEKVTKLSLAGRQLTKLPEGLEKLTQLKSLNLYDNKLTDVKDLEKLTQLTRLVLNKNQLTEVPKELEKLTQLERLSLVINKLTNVKGLEKLTQLKVLHLYRNQLTDVTGLEKLDQLTDLRLEGNQLTDVKGLKNLTQLKELYLNANPDLTKAQIDELKKALPNCKIYSNPKK